MEDTMIPQSLDEAFEQAEETSFERPPRLTAGTYTGHVMSAKVVHGAEARKPWIDSALLVRVEDEKTKGSIFHEFELAPLTDKTGQLSAGKIGFIKGQLRKLGYDGRLSELEFNLDQVILNKIRFTVKENVSNKMNEKTGKPYVNTEVVVEELIEQVSDPISAAFGGVEEVF